MQVVAVRDDPGDPGAPVWEGVPSEKVTLGPVPLDAQPNEYIRTSWASRPYGSVREVQVAAAKWGDTLFVRLEWTGSGAEKREFTDGAGVFFPTAEAEDGPTTMGSRAAPVRLWLWRERLAVQAALPAATDLVSRGPGVFRPSEGGAASARVDAVSAQAERAWTVVLSGPAGTGDRMGVAVWDGANEERAGIGAVSSEWIALDGNASQTNKEEQ
jgi:DMSO reductase family type II enzyme heme b subunit